MDPYAPITPHGGRRKGTYKEETKMAVEPTRTVADFRAYAFAYTGAPAGVFQTLSEEHRKFHMRLNRLGKKKRTKSPEECADVDATAFLTAKDWQKLARELKKLPKP